MTKTNTKKDNLKLIFKYISTIISWTFFVLLSIIGILLIYYFISSRLYATKGEKYEPAFSVYTIVSGSMEPTIKVYDVIINTKVDSKKDIKINDVITFTSTNATTAGMTITHRVIGIKELDDKSLCYVTRGDNNTSEDPSCVASNNVIGKVSAVIPQLGRIQFFLASKFGWLCLIVLPALYIIIKDLIKLFKYTRKNKEEDYLVKEKDNINEAFKNNKYNKKTKNKYVEIVDDKVVEKKEYSDESSKLNLKGNDNELSNDEKLKHNADINTVDDNVAEKKEYLGESSKLDLKGNDNDPSNDEKLEDDDEIAIVNDDDFEDFELPKLKDESKEEI